MGIGTARVVQPTALCFSPFQAGRDAFAEQVLAAVVGAMAEHGYAAEDTPLYMYFFSNGGCLVWTAMQPLIAQPGGGGPFAASIVAPLERGGVIFDSAPVYMGDARSGARAISFGLKSPTRELASAGFYVYSALYALACWACRTEMYTTLFWKAVQGAPVGRWRELYFYCGNDPLTDAGKVTELTTRRRTAGARLDTVFWRESQHCGHMRAHRERYLAVLDAFFAGEPVEDGEEPAAE